MPIVPRETPTPMPIFLPVSSVITFGGSVDDALGVVEDENVVVLVGSKFQPFKWTAGIVVAICAVNIDVSHPEATPLATVTLSYRMTLICCPAVTVDAHSLIIPSEALSI
jgi:hypothetical protein